MNKPDCGKCENVALWDAQICGACRPMLRYKAYLERKRKYRPGAPITTFDELNRQAMVYVFGKPNHIGFVHSLQYRLLADLLKRGRIHHAIRKDGKQ